MFTCMFLHSAVINYVTEGALLISVHMFTENAPIVKMYFRHRAQEMCESRGGRPGLPSLIIPMVSVDVKLHLKKLCTIHKATLKMNFPLQSIARST